MQERLSTQAAASWLHRSLTVLLGGLLLPLASGCTLGTRLDYLHLFSRQGWQRTDVVIEKLALEPGQHVADLGAGDGYFSFYLADAVGPTGRVYAVELDPERVAELRAEVASRGYSNIEVIQAAADDPRLPAQRVDLVFLCNAYHHFEDRVAYFSRLQHALAPNARVAVIDAPTSGVATWFVPKGHGLDPGVLAAELGAAGYRHLQTHDFLPIQTFDVFARGHGEAAAR